MKRINKLDVGLIKEPHPSSLSLKAPITTAADDKFCDIFPNFLKNKVLYFMRIVCHQTVLMKYYSLFVNFEKSSKFFNCCLLQIIGGALRVNPLFTDVFFFFWFDTIIFG